MVTNASRSSPPRTAKRRLQFCCGHRVLGHEGKCRHLHGHNYVAWLHARVTSPQVSSRLSWEGDVDRLGRVIDFGVLKERVGGWIERNWDHAFVLYREDPLVDLWEAEDGPLREHALWTLPYNPTAENMAAYLLTQVCPEVLDGVEVEVWRVELFETENCSAVAELGPVVSAHEMHELEGVDGG